MATTENIIILRADGTKAVATLRELKEAIEKSKDELVALGLVEDSDIKKKEQQAEITKRLDNELKLLNQVMQAGKTTTLAAAKATQVGTASYYEMQKALTTLKKAWKDLSAEERQNAEGNEILNKIKVLDAELKKLDSDIGQFQRNVGNYGQSFKQSLEEAQKGAMGLMQGAQALSGMLSLNAEQTETWQKAIVGLHTAVLVVSSVKGIGGLINKLREYFTTSKAATAATEAQTAAMTAEATATATATAATKAFKAALISTGIGAVVVAIGALIANLDKVGELLGIVNSEAEKTCKDMEEEFKKLSESLEFQVELYKARGATQEEVLNMELDNLTQLKDKADEYLVTLTETYAIINRNGSLFDAAWERYTEATDNLKNKLNEARFALEGFLTSSETSAAQRGMTDLEKAIDNVHRNAEAMKVTLDTLFDQGMIGAQQYLEYLHRIRDAEEEGVRAAQEAAAKTERESAKKIAEAAEDAALSEEERLRRKYERELALLNKYHIDARWLTQKYNDDLFALEEKRYKEQQQAREQEAAEDKREADEAQRRAEKEAEAKITAVKKASEAKLTALEKEGEADVKRASFTIDNEEELASKTYEIEMASYQARLEALQAFVEQANAINDTETALQYQQEAADLSVQIELRALEEKQRIRERDKKNQQASAKQIVASTSTIFGAMAEIYEANGKEDAKAQKKAKNLRIAGATIDMFQGAVTAYSTAQSLGPIAGPIVGAINAAAVIAAGTANIAKIKAQDVSGSGDSSAGAATATVEAPSVEPVVNEVRTVTSASEEDRLNSMAKDQRVYILSSDIEADQQQKRVQVAESTF